MAHFIGIGVSGYAAGSAPLEHAAICDVQRVADALAPHFHPTVMANPDEATLRAKLGNVPNSLPRSFITKCATPRISSLGIVRN